MQAMLAVARGIDRVNAFIGKGVIWLIFLAVLVSAANAISRKLFDLSSNAWLELQWYLFGAAFMGAAAYTLQQNEHIRIDVFYGSRSRKTQHWIDLLGHIFFLLPFVALMAWLLWPYTIQAYVGGQVSSNAGGLIIWPARAILLIGFIMLSVQALSEIVKKIAVMQGLIEDPHPFISAQDQALQEVEELVAEVQGKKAEVQK
jgi:TRAP-type mannitol/chloroaromatic compound transport system permease small subunit